ncbi:hypothetical protein ES708_24430 [subsurface metagenome]
MWSCEKDYQELFGIRGFKSLVNMFMNEINILRNNEGMAPYTEADMLIKLKDKMVEYDHCDNGPT